MEVVVASPVSVLGVDLVSHVCWVSGCGVEPAVQWRRRLTDAELAEMNAEGGWAQQGSEVVRSVHACGAHSISLEAAARVHLASCTAAVAKLPACGCVPEPVPVPTAPPVPMETLATGWIVPSVP